MPIPPPASHADLLERARALDGLTLGALAAELGQVLPAELLHGKGRVGALLELALGASGGNRDLPDFPELGVELKTIPADALGRVRESTFVCGINLCAAAREEWATSRARRKLACVLWFPVEAPSTAPLPERHLGTPRLWRPSPEEEALLCADWSLLMGRIAAGGLEQITAHLGEVLQIRPKARRAADRAPAARGPEGEALAEVPRGFYLRARFTERVLWRLSGE